MYGPRAFGTRVAACAVLPASLVVAKDPVVVRADGAVSGYTLFAPLRLKDTFLVDMEGRTVRKWTSRYPAGQSVHLLDNGHLMRCARDPAETPFHSGGEGGRIEEFDWDGNLVWSFVHSSAEHRHHHDIEPMPNGHVLVISWESKTREQAIAAGRDPSAAEQGMWPDSVLEVEPVRPEGGKIVWEWHVWDHIVQDRDPKKPNYAAVAAHPELLDVNAGQGGPKRPPVSDGDIARLKAIGYLGGDGRRDEEERTRVRRGMQADWNHLNSVRYNPELDQILLSSHNQSEIWIIDHGTTTAEASGHTGGRYGQGGDLLYRWGNPAVHGAGTEKDQKLFGPHDARWIEKGRPGEGHVIVFNNGVTEGFMSSRPDPRDRFSSVLEIALPSISPGRYALERGKVFGPAEPTWSFADRTSNPPMFSPVVSGTQRLPNGNTLITSGTQNRIFEVTPDGKIVWDYRSPYGADEHGPGGHPMPGGPGEPMMGPPPRGAGGAGGLGPSGEKPGIGPPMGPPGGIFRAIRITLDHPALKGKKLEPLPEPPSPKLEGAGAAPESPR
jgi:hypothetical protein